MAAVVQPPITLGGGSQLQLPQDTPTTGVPAGGTDAWGSLATNWAFDGTEVAHYPNGFSESEYLRFKNFGFDIPAAATIDGIEVYLSNDMDLEWANMEDVEIKLAWGASAATLSTNSNFTSGVDNKPLQTRILGGAADLWGSTPTRTDVVSTDFGFVMKSQPQGGSRDAGIQGVGMRVFYTHTLTSPGNLRVTQAFAEVLSSVADASVPIQRHPIIVT